MFWILSHEICWIWFCCDFQSFQFNASDKQQQQFVWYFGWGESWRDVRIDPHQWLWRVEKDWWMNGWICFGVFSVGDLLHIPPSSWYNSVCLVLKKGRLWRIPFSDGSTTSHVEEWMKWRYWVGNDLQKNLEEIRERGASDYHPWQVTSCYTLLAPIFDTLLRWHDLYSVLCHSVIGFYQPNSSCPKSSAFLMDGAHKNTSVANSDPFLS